MISSAPAPAPPVSHRALAALKHPVVVFTARAAAVLAGIALGITSGYVALLVMAVRQCEAAATAPLCVIPGAEPLIEWPLVLSILLAPMAGGIAAAVDSHWRPFVLGLATMLAAAVSLAIVSIGQTSVQIWS